MWDLYLAYCEAAFAERYIGDFQLLLPGTAHRGLCLAIRRCPRSAMRRRLVE
jgi:hypothetical protein